MLFKIEYYMVNGKIITRQISSESLESAMSTLEKEITEKAFVNVSQNERTGEMLVSDKVISFRIFQM